MTRMWRIGIVMGVLALALTGCTGAVHPPATPSPAATLAPPPKFSGIQHPLPTGTATANDPGLYENAVLTGCSAAAGGWRGTGTLKNPGTTKLTATVLVLFTDAQARVVDSATAKIAVAPGVTATWKATRKFTASSGTRCVLRAVHGD